MSQTRIGIIRDAIKAEGGRPPQKSGEDYFADGLCSDCSSNAQKRANEAIYKIPRDGDNLSVERRKRVVDALRAHPDVKDAYLSRPYNSKWISHKTGGHLKVVFQN